MMLILYCCRGGGAAEFFHVQGEVDVHIGTLSKAFGSHGGFVAGSHALKDFLMNRGRSYVFSTSLPLPAVAAAHAALRECQQVNSTAWTNLTCPAPASRSCLPRCYESASS